MVKKYSGSENLEIMLDAKNYNSYLCDQVLKWRPTNCSTAVDFGAGSGTFAQLISRSISLVECVEQDSHLSEQIKNKGFNTFLNLNSIPDASRQFIYSLNVLEHIDKDAETVSELGKKLTTGGTLLIYVPAFNALWSHMDTAVGHYRRYKRGSLKALFDESWSVVECDYLDSLGFFAALSLKYLGAKSGKLNPRMVKIYDKYIFPLSRLLDSAKLPFGKNLILVAKKK